MAKPRAKTSVNKPAMKCRNNSSARSDDELQHIQGTQKTKKPALSQPCCFYTAAVIT